MENDNHYWDITAKYLQGKADLSEQRALQQWRESDAEHEAQFMAQEKLWKLTEYTAEQEVNTEKAWNQVKLKIDDKLRQQTPIRSMILSGLKIAASILIVFSFFWLFKNYESGDDVIVVKSGDKKIEVILPDSSRVWLNKGSQLTYAKDFSISERNVRLEGEGFFDVRKDPKRPFIIQTENVKTKVLGTSFNLRNYPADASIDLAVATGRVSFKAETGTEEAIVTPGKGASFSKSDKHLSNFSISNNNVWAWRTGKLKFDNEPLKKVLADLERFYGIEVKVPNNNLATCRFSGNFQNPMLEEVLQVLQITLDLNYKKTAEHTYLIMGDGCGN